MKYFPYMMFILLLFLVSCSPISTYDDDEIVADVNGEKITVGDLRFLYPDNTALDYVEWEIKMLLIKQKVENMGFDLLVDSIADHPFAKLPPKNKNDQDSKQIRAFAKAQGKKLHMKAEEFQRVYANKLNERNKLIEVYLEAELGEIDDGEDMLIFNEKSNELLEQLVKENEADIHLYIEK